MSLFDRFSTCVNWLGASLAIILVSLLVGWREADAVTPPAQGGELPPHVVAAQKEISESYGQDGIAHRLQALKWAREEQAKSGVSASPSMVTVSVPAILGNYSNVSHIFTPIQYNGLLNATAPTSLSMHNYYLEVSGGQFALSVQVLGPYTAANTQAYYVNGDNGFGTDYPTNASGFIYSLIGAADPSTNFASYDNDGPDGNPNSGDDDGFVDALIVIFPDGDASGGDADNIWAHKWNLQYGAGAPYTTNDAKFGGGFVQIDAYTIQGGEQGNGTWNLIKPVGVFCHEFGHILGLPDLYDSDGNSLGVGTWCLMGLGSWGSSWSSATEDRPVHMSAWCLVDLGWVIPTVVPPGGLTVDPTTGVFKLWEDAYQGGRYFLVETRFNNPGSPGFDAGLPGDGMLIWHVNEEVFFNNSVNNYRVVDLEEADGLNEIDNNADWMDYGDMYPGSTSNTAFTDASSPNSRDVFGVSTGVAVNGNLASVTLTPRTLDGYTLAYSGHTWMGGWGFGTPQTNFGAVRFNATSAGDLVAVQAGVFAGTPVGYSVRIFDDMISGTPTNLLTSTSGSFPNFPNDRYQQITLPSAVTLAASQTFLVDVSWGPDTYAVPMTYRKPFSGQSFWSANGGAASYIQYSDKDVAIRARIRFPSFVCPVVMTGDVNISGSLTSADIIALVNYVFKSGAAPLPCIAAADVNCSVSITSADIIYLVNFVFKSGTAPCDVCPLIQAATWTCP